LPLLNDEHRIAVVVAPRIRPAGASNPPPGNKRVTTLGGSAAGTLRTSATGPVLTIFAVLPLPDEPLEVSPGLSTSMNSPQNPNIQAFPTPIRVDTDEHTSHFSDCYGSQFNVNP
jgi:hypothetical protein